MYETKVRRLILRLALPAFFFFLFFFIKHSQGAVRCASTRLAGVGYVYDEDVQLLTLAANSPDALPGQRSPNTYKNPNSASYASEYNQRPQQPLYTDSDAEYPRLRSRQYPSADQADTSRRPRPEYPVDDEPYGQDWSPQNDTDSRYVYPVNGPGDRASRYVAARNDSPSGSYGEDDSWKPVRDEPIGRQYGRPSRQNQNSTNIGQRPAQYDDNEAIDYGRPKQRTYASYARPMPLYVSNNERDEEDTGPDAVSERYSPRDDYDEDSCPIETRETKSHQTDFPLSSASAVLSVPIGDFILYAAEAPGKAIITYNLNCDKQDARGNEPLYTATASSCFQLKVVEDLLERDRPAPLVICLAHGAFSTAFRVDYDQNQFRLQPCLQIIEHKFLTDVATIPAGRAGALVAFSNNDLRPEAEYHETIAPIYIARAGQLFLCGYVDVQHTTDVALWHVQGNEYVVAYIERRPASRRSLLHFFEITIKNGHCHSIRPRRKQPSIGGGDYGGQRNTLCASEPFTIDQAICGAEDIQFLSSHDKRYHESTHLAIAIANDVFEEGGLGCPDEELICPDNARDKCFCACPHANHRSFVIEFNSKSKTFDFTNHQGASFQELVGGPESVTEITHLPTEKCCMVFQTISPLGSTELYTIEKDWRGSMRVYQFFDSGLPHFVEKSSFGYCSANDLIISYTLHSFQTDNTIYHLQCNKDRRQWSDRSYRNDEGYPNRDEGYSERGYRTGAPSRDSYGQQYYGNNSNNNYRVSGRDSYGSSVNNRSSYPQNYYKYRPYTLPPSQSSASSYGRPRISATLPDMDYGNATYNVADAKQAFAQYAQVNRTSAQQYNRPNQVKPFYSQSPSVVPYLNNQAPPPQAPPQLPPPPPQPSPIRYPDNSYRSPAQYPLASPPSPPLGGWPLPYNAAQARQGSLYGMPSA